MDYLNGIAKSLDDYLKKMIPQELLEPSGNKKDETEYKKFKFIDNTKKFNLFGKLIKEIECAKKIGKKIEFILFSNKYRCFFETGINTESMKYYTNEIMGIKCGFSNEIEKGFVVFYKKVDNYNKNINYESCNDYINVYNITSIEELKKQLSLDPNIHKGDIILVSDSDELNGSYYIYSVKPIEIQKIINNEVYTDVYNRYKPYYSTLNGNIKFTSTPYDDNYFRDHYINSYSTIDSNTSDTSSTWKNITMWSDNSGKIW